MQELTRASAPTPSEAKNKPILEVIRAVDRRPQDITIAVNNLSISQILQSQRQKKELKEQLYNLRDYWKELKRQERAILAPAQNRCRPNYSLGITSILQSQGIQVFTVDGCCPCVKLNTYALSRVKQSLKQCEQQGHIVKQ